MAATSQREEVAAKIGMLQAAKEQSIVVPTEEEVASPLQRLGEILLAAARRGRLHTEIAQDLGCSRSNITKLLKYAYAQHGEEWIDGRTLRWGRPRAAKQRPGHEPIADQVKTLLDEGHLLQEIGEMLGVGRDAVTAAKKYWYASRDLPVPDGRSRRKELVRKVSHPRRTARRMTTESP